MNANRREFLKSTLTGGALIAMAELPILAAEKPQADFAVNDDPSRWPQRDLRINLVRQRIEAGASLPFSVLHISDTHLCAVYPHEPDFRQRLRVRNNGFGGCQEMALRDSLAYGKRNCDYVLHTGDLIDWPSVANFDLVRKYLGDKEIFGCLGNHEWYRDGAFGPQDEATRQKSIPTLQRSFAFDIVLHSQVINGVNFVTLDNVFGTVNAGQVERFMKEAEKGLPIVLCCHMPIFTDFIWHAYEKCHRFHNCNRKSIIFDTRVIPISDAYYRFQINNSATNAFVKYLKTEKLLKGILAGHLHMTVNERFSPTAIQAVTGANYLFHAQKVNFS